MPIVCGFMRSLCPLLSGHVRMPADVVIVRPYFVWGKVPIYPYNTVRTKVLGRLTITPIGTFRLHSKYIDI